MDGWIDGWIDRQMDGQTDIERSYLYVIFNKYYFFTDRII